MRSVNTTATNNPTKMKLKKRIQKTYSESWYGQTITIGKDTYRTYRGEMNEWCLSKNGAVKLWNASMGAIFLYIAEAKKAAA